MNGMGRPQLEFPRLRVAAGRTSDIAIGPDHTPPGVTRRQNPRTGGAWFAGAGGAVIFSGGMAVSVEMHNNWLRGVRQRNRPRRVQQEVALVGVGPLRV
jgi:hypothetical protein